MIKIVEYLEKLDLSTIEAQIYLSLLESGTLSVAEIANKVQLNRTATYPYLSSLLEKGIIAEIKGPAKKFAANPPENLEHVINKKLYEAKFLQDKLPIVINVLNKNYPQNSSNNNSDITYYRGRNGILKIYNESLNCSELRLYITLSEIAPLFPENENLFEKAFAKNKKLKIFEIYGDASEEIKHLDYVVKNDRYFYKFMPSDVHLTAECILLYDEKVSIINISDKKNINGVVLKNKDYYNNSVQLFDLLWRFLPDPQI